MPGVVNQQGGLGKTTLSMARAHALLHTGTKVCIVDAGPPAAAPGCLGR
jgi:cellulose biosynthesis protein BcsQ